jgi:DNA-binding transcriptional MerR regulator
VTEKLLRMRDLAAASGVSPATIKHYLREGLLGDEEVVRTSRNMAYYPEAYVDRVRLIKRLQQEQFLPLHAIRERLERDRVSADAGAALSRAEAEERFAVPRKVLERLEELEVLSAPPYGAEDVRIVEAIARFRAGGYEESLGFTVYDTLRYREALQPLVEEETAVLLSRLAGEEVDRAVDIITSGREPLRDLIGAMHAKLLRRELERVTSARRDAP